MNTTILQNDLIYNFYPTDENMVKGNKESR